MKKSLAIRLSVPLALLLYIGLIVGVKAAASEPDPNQLLSFKKIFIGHVDDNVDGVFGETFSNAYKVVFEKNPRFELVSSVSNSDSIIKTKVEKKPATIDYEVSLHLNPSGDLFYTFKSSITALATSEELSTAAKRAIKAVLKKIPFYGSITGISGDLLTFDIGSGNGLKEGDVVELTRIDKVKRHPLLKSVLDVEVVNIGKAVIETVESTISFARVTSEEPGEKILRSYKVTGIVAKSREPTKESDEQVIPDDGFVASKGRFSTAETNRPELGYVGLGPVLGSLSNSISQNNGALNADGSSFSPGVLLYGELWLTKNIFVDYDFSYVTSSLTMVNEKTAGSSLPLSVNSRQFSFDLGYRHLVWNSMKGPSVYVKLGFNAFYFIPPSDNGWVLGNRKYKGLRLGAGGSIPIISKRHQFFMGVSLAPDPGFDQTSANISPDSTQGYSATMTQFQTGYSYDVLENMSFRALIFLDIYTVEFTDGAVGFGKSTSMQKQFGFVPSLLFYF